MTALEKYFERTGLRNIVVSDSKDPESRDQETGEPETYFARCRSCNMGGTCTDCDIFGTSEEGWPVDYDTVPLCESCRLEAEYGPDAE